MSIFDTDKQTNQKKQKKNRYDVSMNVYLEFPVRTLWSPGVDLLHGVVESDPDGGEAHLSLEPRHQAAVQAAGPLRPHHGADGPEHAPVALAPGGLWFSLDLTQTKVWDIVCYNISAYSTAIGKVCSEWFTTHWVGHDTMSKEGVSAN